MICQCVDKTIVVNEIDVRTAVESKEDVWQGAQTFQNQLSEDRHHPVSRMKCDTHTCIAVSLSHPLDITSLLFVVVLQHRQFSSRSA